MTIFRHRLIAFVFAAVFGTDAQASIFIVGTGAGCTHGTIQAAIDAANNSAGADTVRLTRSLTYEPEADSIDTAQELTVEGGYATCDQATADTTLTVVSGAGGVHAPVFTITAPTGALIHLRRLTLSGGDVDGGIAGGGGIRFVGDGVLDVADCFITKNRAGQGGGIYAQGTGSNAELVIGANVTISSNTAVNGGGVMIEGVEMSMLGENSIILLNHAVADGGGGVGGGLFVRSGSRPSFAYIGSGTPTFGALYGNDASYGGGVAIESPSNNYTAQLQLFATDPARPAYVGSNSASLQGGGIHVFGSKASARLWNAAIDDNLAANGAAAYLAAGSSLYVNFAALPAAAAGCAVGVDCGSISNNVADSDTSSDAIVYGETGTTIQIGYLPTAAPADARGGVLIRKNQASTVFGGAASTQIYRTVISDNTTSSDLIKQSTNPLSLVDSTIAGNAIGGGSAILRTANSAVTIQRSILWQPGSTSLSRSGGSLAIDNTDASESASLGGGFAAYTFDPFFIDPAHGDYGLRAGSGAIDFAPATILGDRDAYAQSRNIDLLNPDFNGRRDIGALERQSLQPIVLNGDFDYSDLRLWTKFDGAWDGTENAAGGSGSGSWKYSIASTNAVDAIVAEQCIVLPAAATYRLDGWGKGGGSTFQNRDYAIVKWEVRKQTNGACTAGVVASGQLTLGSGTSWGHPAQPAIIDLPEEQFGNQLSIRLILVAHDGGSTALHPLSAWFDGITLEVEPSDVIFEDGFD